MCALFRVGLCPALTQVHLEIRFEVWYLNSQFIYQNIIWRYNSPKEIIQMSHINTRRCVSFSVRWIILWVSKVVRELFIKILLFIYFKYDSFVPVLFRRY